MSIDILDKELSDQDFSGSNPRKGLLDEYKVVARNYALIENTVAVLSDMRENVSYIYYGGFSQMLGLDCCGKECTISSIWEEDIFSLIHPDDIAFKHAQELRFFHFMKRQPKRKRNEYSLMCTLRMKSRGKYISVLHRMFYVPFPDNDTMWLALCLYGPQPFGMPAKCIILNSVNGEMTELEGQENEKILSPRERQVLSLIDRGLMSKEIAASLSISIHTVSRHRQDILEKLKVKNSIEACRIAKELNLIISPAYIPALQKNM